MNEGQVPGSALAPHQVAVRLQGQVSDGITWARRRKAKFRRSASGIRIVSLVLAVASTTILGLQQLNFWTGLAFSFVAVGTLVTAVEPFFNWRSRWILMEEAQYKLRRLQDELEYYLMKTPVADVALDDLDPFFERLRASGPKPASAGLLIDEAARLDQNNPAAVDSWPHLARFTCMSG